MNNSQDQPSQAKLDQAELVAYLDHELHDAAQQRVEQRLGEDPAYQEQLQSLQRSWDCLDALPSVPTSERFTETTLEMVAQQARQELDEAQGGDRPWLRYLTGGALVGFVMLAAFGIVFSAYRSAADHELKELPMIDNVDLYRQVDRVEFLEELDEADLVSPTTTVPAAEGAVPVGQVDSNDLRALRARATKLAPLEKEELRAKRARFEGYSADEQQRIRQLHAGLAAHPDRLQLHRVLVQYTDWLCGLTARQQLDLKEMQIDARIDAIRKMQHDQEQKALEEFAITPEDAAAIERWLGEFAQSHREIEARLPPEFLQRLKSSKDPNQKRRMFIGAFYFSRSRGTRPVAIPSAEKLQGLLDQLTPSVRERLEQLEDSEEQFRMLVRWARGYLRDRFRQVKKEDLEAFFHQLPPAQRERLEAMSPPRMQSELTGLYHRARFHDPMGGPGFEGRSFPGSDDGRRRGGFSRRRWGENGAAAEGRPALESDRQQRPERRHRVRPPGGPPGPPPPDEERPSSIGAP